MEFLAAPLLWGLTATAIPVLVHLLGRNKPVTHRFPAVRFILRSQRSSSRALRLKHLLVLLLRMAVVASLVLALARPLAGGDAVFAGWAVSVGLAALLAGLAFARREYLAGVAGILLIAALWACYPSESSAPGPQIKGDYVLVLDQSMSMSYEEPEGTRFELARRGALAFLGSLAPDARVALVFAAEKAERAQGRLSYRHDVVRRRLSEAQVTGRGLELASALDAAAEILARDKSAQRAAVVLFTDLQGYSVTALLGRSSLRGGAPKLPLVVVDVGSPQARNGAALAAQLAGGVLPAETRATLIGKVRPLDRDRPCLVELYVDERRVAQKLVDGKGQDAADVELDFASGAAGLHQGRLHLPVSDRLAMDQDCRFVYTAGRPASALIVEASATAGSSSSAGKGTGWFLRAALQPYSSDDPVGMSGLTCVVQQASAFDPAKLAAHRVLVLADCGRLGASAWATVQHWVSEGGGLFVWLGPRSDLAETRRYAFQEYAAGGGLLPGHIGGLTDLPQPEAITVAQPEHPVLAHATPSVVSLLRAVRVNRLVKVTPETRDPNCNVVLQLGDGSPFLLEKAYGRGRVLLCAASPDLACSDLPKQGEAFVTLVLDALRLLSGEDRELRGQLGFPLVLTLTPPPGDGLLWWEKPGVQEATVVRVEGSARSDLPRGPAMSAPPPATVIVPPLETPGVHRFTWLPAGAKTRLVKQVAVNPDARESDLVKAPPELLHRALADWDTAIVRNVFESAVFGEDGAATRREFAAGILVALLGLMLAESFLANRLYRRGPETEAEGHQTAAEVASEQAHGAS
jgi:hypothetical protein